MARKETQKIKAEKLDKLRKIFKRAYLVQLMDDRWDELEVFTYKTLVDSGEIAEAQEFDEEVAIAFDGEHINDLMLLLTKPGE